MYTTLVKEQPWDYFTQSGWEDKRIHTFLKGISLKMNVIAWLEFELVYFEATVQHFSHYAMKLSPSLLVMFH